MSAFTDFNFWVGVATLAAIWGIFTLGIQVNAGTTGLLNFGQAGIMAVGAYTMAILVVHAGWSLWLAMPISALAAMAVSVLMGVITSRLRKDYFAIASLAIAQLAVTVAQNARDVTGGGKGLFGYDNDWYDLSFSITSAVGPVFGVERPMLPLAVVAWILFIVFTVALAALSRTGWGRVLRSIREDEDAARALGKNVDRFKLQSLAVSGLLGAVSGWLLALSVGLLAPSQFDPTYTFLAYAALIIGGLGSYRGVLFGSVVLWTLLEGTRLVDLPLDSSQLAAVRYLIIGLVLMVLIAKRPQGLFGQKEELTLDR
jgi:branched-chain amino acid transport system permease protein